MNRLGAGPPAGPSRTRVNAGRRLARKNALFERGAAAARAVLGCERLYVCPLCGKRFGRLSLENGQLTLEHIPPRALGGKGIILTCAACNNTAGHSFDAEIARRAALHRFKEVFLQKSEGGGGRAVLNINDTPILVEVRHEGGTTTFRVLEEFNNPASVETVKTYCKELALQGKGDGEIFKVTAKAGYHARLARVGDLRCAFLACTAAFGYRFAFAPALGRVREQILRPDQEILPQWWVRASADRAFQIAVSEPKDLVLVTCRGQSTMLPWPSRQDGRYLAIAQQLARGARIEMRATAFAWPTFFHARLDLSGA